jgi:hypothetical protein
LLLKVKHFADVPAAGSGGGADRAINRLRSGHTRSATSAAVVGRRHRSASERSATAFHTNLAPSAEHINMKRVCGQIVAPSL